MKYFNGRFIIPPMTVVVNPFASRPPVAYDYLIIEPTIGCPRNKDSCSFCNTYKETNFRYRGIDEIKTDISIAKRFFGNRPTKAFLLDANSFVLKTDELIKICYYLFNTFPYLEGVRSYASASSVLKKPEEELRKLSQVKLNIVDMGVETGNRYTLEKNNKGATPEDMIKAAEVLSKSDIQFSASIICGLGGKGTWEENAEPTAEVLNRMKPKEVRIHNLELRCGSPCTNKHKEGNS